VAVVRRRALRTIRGAARERGTCAVCGRDYPLVFTSGMLKQHGDCSGSGRPPVESRAEQTVRTDERL
jgi:hypothetical protein